MATATIDELLPGRAFTLDASDSASILDGSSNPVTDGNPVSVWRSTLGSWGTIDFLGNNDPLYDADYDDSGRPAVLTAFDSTACLYLPGLNFDSSAGDLWVLLAVSAIGSSTNQRWLMFTGDPNNYREIRGSSGTLFLLNNRVAGSNLQSGGMTWAEIASGGVLSILFRNTGHGSCVLDAEHNAGKATDGTQANNMIGIGVGCYLNPSNGNRQSAATLAIHELIVGFSDNVETGQLLRAAEVLRDKWGLPAQSPLPEAATGGGGSVLLPSWSGGFSG